MANEEINRTVSRKWYRCPIDPQLLRALNQRSDLKGFGQTLGHLGILVIEFGVGLTVASVMISIFYYFAGRAG